jgi:hypothetical protein
MEFKKIRQEAEEDRKTASQFVQEPLTEDSVQKNFKREKPKKLRKILFFSIFFLLLILGATLLGFWLFGGKSIGSKSVELKLQVPFEVSSGEEVKYIIKIKNKEKVAIEKVDLLLQYPYGFEFESTDLEPLNEAKNSFALPDILAGESYTLEIKGRLIGEIDETKNLTAILNYQPANFSSNFQIKKTAVSLINDSILGLVLEYPDTILKSQSFDLKIKYKNNQQTAQENIKVIFDLPSGYIIETEGTTPAGGEWFWQQSSLSGGQEEEIIIKGYIEDSGEKEVEVKIGFIEEGEFKTITYKKVNLLVVSPEVEMDLTLNNQAEVSSVNWQEELDYTIKIKNNSSNFSIPQARLELKLNFDLLDKNSLEEGNGAVLGDSSIIWGEDSDIWTNFLKSLSPGQEKEISLKISTISQPDNLDDYTASDLTIEAEAIITSDELGEDFILNSNKLITTVGDLVQFSAKAYYNLNESVQVGSGPLPPEVGETTIYKVYWYLNSGNANLENITIKAILPPDISWQEDYQSTNGQIDFDSASRQITWNIDELLIGDYAQANFFISLTPEESQVGEVITLLNLSTITYERDNNAINQTINSLDTDLQFDSINSGQGKVIE